MAVAYMDVAVGQLGLIETVLPKPARIIGSLDSPGIEVVRLAIEVPDWPDEEGPTQASLHITYADGKQTCELRRVP